MELMVESGPDAGKVFQVGQTMLVAGRQIGVDILLNDDQISRRHASFEEVNNILYLNDLGSANGTRLNGRAITANQPLTLAPGDRVKIGRTTLVVQTDQKDEPTLTELAGAFPANTPYAAPAPPAYYNDPPDQYQNEPPAGYYQSPNQGYNASGPDQAYPAQEQAYPGPEQAYPQEQAYQAPGPYAPPVPAPPAMYYPNIPAPVAPVKKSSSAPIIIGIVGILIVAAIAIGAILVISGGTKTATPTSQSQVTTPGGTQGPIVPTAQPLIGPSGSNALPPPPPENVAVVTPTPGSSAAGVTQGLGIAVKFPTDWKTTVDEGQNVIESDGPDSVTFSLVYRRSGLTGTPVDRLTAYLKSSEPNIPNFTLTRPVQAVSSDNSIADAYVTYTDKDGKLLQREYIVATANKAGDTYFIHFSTEDASFDKQISTFNSILQSIVIN